MATSQKIIDEIKKGLDALESVDPTPENRMAIKAMLKDIRGRVEALGRR